ncbi:MAG: sugar 3,4-ketoisomerase [Spirosomataceae bacterium]
MPTLKILPCFQSDLGDLTVLEGIFPGPIKRVYYIYDVPHGVVRGGHRHHKTWQILVCIRGKCRVYVHDGQGEHEFWLDRPDTCLILEPTDWHTMHDFSQDALLLVLANEPYDKADYIDEPYPNS